MEELRSFAEEHVADAADLYLRSVRGQNRPAPPALGEYFREVYFRNPWRTPGVESIAYMIDGKLAGFLGVIPRPWTFHGKPILAAASTLFMMDRRYAAGFGAMRILRRFFDGPQDISFSEGTADQVTPVFAAAGAKISYLYSFNWMRVLRPFGVARHFMDRFGRTAAALKGPAGLLAGPLDALVSKAPLAALRRPACSLLVRPVSAAELFDVMAESKGREALRPVHDRSAFEWHMEQAGAGPGHAGFRMAVASASDGTPAGWFIYYARPGGMNFVLQVAALRKQQIPYVLDALFADAWTQGVAGLKGQIDPRHLVAMTARHCVFRQPDNRYVVHARNPEILSAFLSGDTAVSKLDAGGWLRIPVEPWT